MFILLWIYLRQNDLLKSQVKKYVEAIQLLKSESFATGKFQLGGLRVTHLIEISSDPEGRDSVSAYEGKLIQVRIVTFIHRRIGVIGWFDQVAEMHAELMEFNERLQMELNRKNLCISRLLSEISFIKGPVRGQITKI